MTFKNKITFSFLWNIILIIISFFNNSIVTIHLSPHNRGEYIFFISNTALISMILSMGIFSAIVYFSGSNKVESGKIFYSFTLAFFLASGLVFGGMFFLKDSGFVRYLVDSEKRIGFLVAAIFLSLMSSLISSIILSKQKINAYNVIQLSSPVFLLFFYISIWVFNFKIDTDLFISVYSFSLLIPVFLSGYLLFKDKYLTKISFLSYHEIKLLIQFGSFAFLCDVVQFSNYRLDFWFIKYYGSEDLLGIYSLSGSLAQLIWIIPTAVSTVLFPWMASLQDDEQYRKSIIILSRVILSVCFIGSLIGLIALEYLVPIVFGKSYEEVVVYYSILIFGVVPYCLTKLYASILAGKNKIKLNFIASLGGFIITIIFNFFLTRLFLALGASITTVFSYLVSTLIVLYFIKREWGFGWKEYLIPSVSDFHYIKAKIIN